MTKSPTRLNSGGDCRACAFFLRSPSLMRVHKTKRCLSVINLTEEAIEISLEDPEVTQCLTLQAHETSTVSYSQRRPPLELSISQWGSSEKISNVQCNIRLKKRITGRRKWKELDCAGETWRLYQQKISKRHQRILVFAYRPLSSWMKEIPDSVLLSNLCLPGGCSPRACIPDC